jgi:omega-amidase
VIACNRAGSDGDAQFGGHSVICDPWGERCIEGGSAPALLTASIDFERVEDARRRMPVLSDRRPDLYSSSEAPER